jgi:protein SMG8
LSAERLSSGSGLFAASDRSPSGFAAFVMPHVELALTRGFDDNVGRNPVAAIFELATLADWAFVAEQLHGMFWATSDSRTQNSFAALKSLTDIDVRFSERQVYHVLVNYIHVPYTTALCW